MSGKHDEIKCCSVYKYTFIFYAIKLIVLLRCLIALLKSPTAVESVGKKTERQKLYIFLVLELVNSISPTSKHTGT